MVAVGASPDTDLASHGGQLDQPEHFIERRRS
jgi:hypothetical protein